MANSIFSSSLTSEMRQARKDYTIRLAAFAAWLTETNGHWYEPNLEAFQEYLLTERRFAPLTVNAYLSAVRSWYREKLKDGTIQAALEPLLLSEPNTAQYREELDNAIKALVEATNPKKTYIKVDRPQPEYLRPKAEQLIELFNSPNLRTLSGLRDKALLTFLFCTGIRENELCALTVSDLERVVEGELCLHVPAGPGCVERWVPYGSLTWGLQWGQEWLEAARITEGFVFRGFYKHSQTVRSSKLSPRAVEYIFASYPVHFEEQTIPLRPLDLRRTYARLLYEASRKGLHEIKARLGVKDSKTLVDYIGGEEAGLDVPSGIDFFDASQWKP